MNGSLLLYIRLSCNYILLIWYSGSLESETNIGILKRNIGVKNMPLLGLIFWLSQTSYDNGWYVAICIDYTFWMLYFLWSRLGFGFETNILVIKVPNPYIAHELCCTEMLHVSTKLSLAGPTLRQSKTLQVNCSVLTQTLGLRVVWIYVNTLFFDCNQDNCVLYTL